MRCSQLIIPLLFLIVKTVNSTEVNPFNAQACINSLQMGDTLNARLCVDAMLLSSINNQLSAERANAYRMAANYYVEKSLFDKAVLYYDSACNVADKLCISERERMLTQIQFNQSLLHSRFGEYDVALSLCLNAYQYYRLNHDKTGIAETANRLGGLYVILGDSAKSSAFNSEAYHASLHSDNDFIKLTCLNAWGNYLLSQNKSDSALLVYNKCIVSAEALNNSKVISDAYYNLSYTYSNFEEYDNALFMIKKAHQWAIKSGSAYDICDTRYKTGLILYYMGQYQAAADTLLKALEEAELIHSAVLQRNLYDVLSYLETERKNYVKALEYLNLYIDYNHLVMSKEGQQQVNYLNARYDAEKREADILQQKILLQKRNYTLLITILVIIVLIVIVLMNATLNRRKRKITQQQLTIHRQKIGELEKEKEIISMQSVLRGEESERGRIARDLHDGLGGMLSGVKLSLNNMNGNQMLSDNDVRQLEKAIHLIDQSVKELRDVAHNMMPDLLIKEGLNTALTNFCESLSGPPKVNYHFFGQSQRYENGFELTVYRIVQELINNALKHAQANEVVTELIQQPDRLSVTVRDNGKGFKTDVQNRGHGLLNLRSRVAGYQGIFDISSILEEGTEITVSFENIEHLVKND
ncbi:MAG TPA: sensor histidine kinase [Marinilabiliaceae bacterium]|nr:sensor histidine kinase [Marinilabiliaceae bacterium]